MMLPDFEFRSVRTVKEAAALWAEQAGARYLAGGTDLLPQMRTRRKVSRVIDIKGIAELHKIREDLDGNVSVGACVSMSAVMAHAGIRKRFPLLVECCATVGAYPLRNRATLAGNVCNASPAADTAAALLALEASVVATGPQGTRTLPLTTFFKGPGRTVLMEGELVTDVVLPAASAGFQGSYLRLSRRKGMDLATVGVLVGRRDHVHRIALCAVAPTPLRVRDAEAVLDQQGTRAGLKEAAAIARAQCSPITDLRGTAEYRRDMVGVLTGRGLMALPQQ